MTAVAAWLLWMTLRPMGPVSADLAPLTRSAARHGISVHLLIDLAGNVAVFVPLGASLALALGHPSRGRRLALATAGGAILSLAIELVQSALPSRVAGLDDLLLNTAGAAIGAALVCGLPLVGHIRHGLPEAGTTLQPAEGDETLNGDPNS